jgi:hypothetical protein
MSQHPKDCSTSGFGEQAVQHGALPQELEGQVLKQVEKTSSTVPSQVTEPGGGCCSSVTTMVYWIRKLLSHYSTLRELRLQHGASAPHEGESHNDRDHSYPTGRAGQPGPPVL